MALKEHATAATLQAMLLLSWDVSVSLLDALVLEVMEVVAREHERAGSALKLLQLFFILLDLLLNVLLVVLDIDEFVAHLAHDLGMLPI